MRRHPATARDGQNSPEKRKVGSSTLPLTTITSLAGSSHHLRLACSRDVFVSILAGMPEYAAECRRVRGELVGPLQTRTCGISVGPAGGFRWLTQSAVQGLRAPARGTDPRLGPVAGWVALLG